MNRKTAEKVLAEVKARYGADDAALYDADHEELPDGAWSIAWEGDSWTTTFETTVPGVFVEPINHVILAIYDA